MTKSKKTFDKMDDIKSKFLSFINKDKEHSAVLSKELDNSVESYVPIKKLLNSSKLKQSYTISEEDVLNSIEKTYYEPNETFDSGRYELQKISDVFSAKEVEDCYEKLIQQHKVVSKKLSQLILQKQTAYKNEFDNILIIENYLKDAIMSCKVGRSSISLTKNHFVTTTLKILSDCRKRKRIKEVLTVLYSLKILHSTNDELLKLSICGDYSAAITLLKRCQQEAETYKQFNCIAALSNNFQCTIEEIEKNLDISLMSMCFEFDVNLYSSIQNAYNLLGKSQIALDQLHMHFTATIHSTAFKTVHRYVKNPEDDTKKQYNLLCKCISSNNILPCLKKLSKSLWAILKSYYSVVKWHKINNLSNVEISSNNVEAKFHEQYINQKLENGILKIWNDIEFKITVFLKEINITKLKLEDFLQILQIIDGIIKLGNKILEKNSNNNIIDCMKQQSLLYINHFHETRLDELRIFLENDGWKLCPVKSSFLVSHLYEFKNLKHIFNEMAYKQVSTNYESKSFEFEELNQILDDNFSLVFDTCLGDSEEEDILLNFEVVSEESDDDVEFNVDNMKNSYVKEYKNKNYNGPIVTNTTLSILRNCGNYLEIARLFKDASATILNHMIQFFEFYFYTVYTFFTSDIKITSDSLYATNLKRTISRIKKSIILDGSESSGSSECKVKKPSLSLTIDLNNSSKLFSLTERIVAVESLIFLGSQYEYFKRYIEDLNSKNENQNESQQIYSQTINSTISLRKPVYMSAISRVFDIENILTLMDKVNWEVDDVMSQHNSYVDNLMNDVNEFDIKLKSIASFVPLSKELYESIWENVAHLITHTLVEGFSNAKKCSNGGRALMQLDFTQFSLGFETKSSLKPMPHKQYVDTYIKAYYVQENDIELWIKTHTEYSAKHLKGLISSVCKNKKTKTRLLNNLQEQSSNQ